MSRSNVKDFDPEQHAWGVIPCIALSIELYGDASHAYDLLPKVNYNHRNKRWRKNT